MDLICVLQALLTLAVICLILYVVWWVVRSLLGVFEIPLPPKLVQIVQIIAVLILAIIVVRAVMTGDYCGPWPGRVR